MVIGPDGQRRQVLRTSLRVTVCVRRVRLIPATHQGFWQPYTVQKSCMSITVRHDRIIASSTVTQHDEKVASSLALCQVSNKLIAAIKLDL